MRLKIPKLEAKNLNGFSDASFANNANLSTQIGHIVFLADENNKAAPISFKSFKYRRVTRSAMEGKVITLSNMFDVAVTLSEELQTLLGYRPPTHLLTDSKTFFDVIYKGSRTSEKRKMLDISAAREEFRDEFTSNIGFVRNSKNLADGLKKPMQ